MGTTESAHLRALEDEAIFVIREVVATRGKVALLFSAGKDSIVLLDLALRAFAPALPPIVALHVDTGHNFPEAIAFRDSHLASRSIPLVTALVEDSIREGRVKEPKGKGASRNAIQAVTLRDAIVRHRFEACFGGARRDEDRARSKERMVSVRDEFGQWDPKSQRPELWDVWNTHLGPGEHLRVFPLSNLTEVDVWNYIKARNLNVPSIYFSHRREVFLRDGMLYSASSFIEREADEPTFFERVRFRTVGDMTCTGAVRSLASDLDGVIAEIQGATLTERGATRADDRVGDAAMEDRKRQGYF